MQPVKSLVVALLSLLAAAGPAGAAVFNVTGTADGVGPCVGDSCPTLRAAIIAANAQAGADTINLPSGTYTLSIAGAGEDLAATGDLDITDITGRLTIQGAGAATTIIDGAGLDRVFDILPQVQVTILGVSIVGGNSNVGGGVFVAPLATLTLDGVTVGPNQANQVPGLGGGIALDSASANVLRTTIRSNTAGTGGGIYSIDSALTLANSTISGNTATTVGGGGGGGVAFQAGVVGAPLLLLALNNTTITSNTAPTGSGVSTAPTMGSTWNSIISGNLVGPDCDAALPPGGFNVVAPDCGGSGTGTQTASDPVLGPLADNGGQTLTHLPLPGSPARDMGNPEAPGNPNACTAQDQTGLGRPLDGDGDGNARCDVGAKEAPTSPPPAPVVTVAATDPTATEAGQTSGVLTFSRTGGTAAALTVFFTVAGTATSGGDYGALPASVQIPAGQANATVLVTAVDDGVVEGDETVTATVSANAAYTVGNPNAATVTIADDDVALSLPQLTGTVNQTAFRTGQTLTLNAVLTPGTTPTLVDAYVVVQLPSGQFLSVLLTGVAVGIVPIATNFAPIPFSGQLIAYTFTGLEGPGTYTVFVALTQPGTLIPIGSIQMITFTFTP